MIEKKRLMLKKVLMTGSGPTVFAVFSHAMRKRGIFGILGYDIMTCLNEHHENGGKEMLNLDLQNHRPLREIVYEELKRQILVGEIAQEPA